MKRLMTALAATTAFAVTPALADNHKDMSDDAKMEHDKMDHDKYVKDKVDSEVTALKASQVFLAMDDENDGLLTESEWADWQNRSQDNVKQFSDYDVDGDGDIELSEYLANFDIS